MKITEKIWHEYHMKLSAFIRSKVSGDIAEDILQDVFVKIHTQIASLKEKGKLESWLYSITRNAIADHYRSKRTMEKLPEWIDQPQPEEEEKIKEELLSCLEPMIKALPDIYRRAVQASEIENKTQKEVAEQENISLSGAKSRVQRGRALLKSMLSDCCQFEINENNQIVSYEKKEKHRKFC